MTVDKLDTIIQTKEKSLKRLKQDFLNNEESYQDYEKVEEYLRNKMTTKIDSVRKQIEPLVNSSLASIFNEKLTFEISTEIFRGKISYNVSILNHKEKIKGTVESHGGGVSAIVSVILRILFIILSDRPRILILDESINPVSPKYRPKTAEFLQKICKELNFQITVITFDENEYFGKYADTVYEVDLDKNSNSVYKKLK